MIDSTAGPDLSEHAETCAACERLVALGRRIVVAGAEPVREVMAELDELFAKLMELPRHRWFQTAREAEYQRPEVVRFLLTRILDARLRDARLAEDLAKVATEIADLLPLSEGRAAVRFDAWMYTASLLRERARYADAESALGSAEEASQSSADPEHSLACVRLSHALLCAEPDVWRPDEADTLLDEAEAVFADRGDARRLLAVLTSRASLSFRSGDMNEARRLFEAVVDATSIEEREAHLDAVSNLMWVRVELGDASDTLQHEVQQLVHENAALRRVVQVARARWMMGRINVALKRYSVAVGLFESASKDIDDPDAAIRIGLDAARTLLLAGHQRKGEEVARALASAAVALDQREPTRRRALTAQVLTYLKEAAQRQAWTPDLVADLSSYIDRIGRQRPVEFIPPMPLADM